MKLWPVQSSINIKIKLDSSDKQIKVKFNVILEMLKTS